MIGKILKFKASIPNLEKDAIRGLGSGIIYL